MALRIPCGLLPKRICSPLPRKILIVGVCALICAWLQAPVALAQHGAHGGGQTGVGGHVGGGHVAAPHVAAPPAAHVSISHVPISHPPISRPSVVFEPRAGFGQRPIFIRHPVFIRPPFFRGVFYPAWFLNCGPAWVWGFGCGDWRLSEYGTEYYVPPPPPIYEYPEYVYYGGPRDFVLLFLKDGTEYSVIDYWFVKEEVHFTTLEEGGAKAVEQVIGLDELDLQKTIDVNTRRGFRFVRRDEPMEQYLRDHPDANPPLVERPPNN